MALHDGWRGSPQKGIDMTIGPARTQDLTGSGVIRSLFSRVVGVKAASDTKSDSYVARPGFVPPNQIAAVLGG